ncbi:MAG: hypothetical protein EBW49_08320, partial [Betaproteobacteria bacterium]|nr:hypothetical protein [Betaproteobacteria bacterium]
MVEISLTRANVRAFRWHWLHSSAMPIPIITLFSRSYVVSFLASFCMLGLLCVGQAQGATQSSPKGSPPSRANLAVKKKTQKTKAAKVVVGKAFGNTAGVRELAKSIAAQQQLPVAWVTKQISQARQIPAILPMVLPPASVQQKNWAAYRARFLSECRIQTGVKFWRDNALLLDQAFLIYGVPPKYIVGILGVETFYGQHQGQYRLIDALSTLSLMFPAAAG